MLKINNPFNLRSSDFKWRGQTGEEKGFCVFETMNHGIRAGILNLYNGYFHKGKSKPSVKEIIHRYAPPKENNTDAYVDFISHRLKVEKEQELTGNADTLSRLTSAICRYENGTECVTVDKALEIIQKEKFIA